MSKKNQPPVKAGGIYPIEITGLGHSGEGVGRVGDFTVFVKGALPTEQVLVKIAVVKKNYAAGEIIAVEKTSPHRASPECGVYKECGACQLQHLSYPEQLKFKETVVAEAVRRIGKLDGVLIKPCLGATNPWHWRNKMQMPVGSLNGKIAAGCFAQSTHRIIPVPADKCLIQHPLNNLILEKTLAVLNQLGISAYDEQTGKGVVRHIMGRVGVKTGQVMVVLITASRDIPQKKRLVSLLQATVPNLSGVIQNINTARTNVILGEETTVLWGEGSITDCLGEFSFEISAKSFFQVNTLQAEILYEKAVTYAAPAEAEIVIDAYCGTGTITLFLAKKAAKAYGIEINPASVADARRNALKNNIHNVEFIAGDALETMPRLYREGLRPGVIVTDPPRAGCGENVLRTFAEMNPERIVYISCNPASLARDLAFLAQNGYIAKEIQPVDIFPQTYHVETIVLIQRRTT